MTVPVGAEDASDQRPGAVPDAPADPGPRPRPHVSARDAAAATCPYLTSSGGSWRFAGPSREHRCAVVDPPAPQPNDKQRRHCLSADHVECQLYRAARTARTSALAAGADPELIEMADRRRRPIARTAPILLESPRLVDRAVRLEFDRASGQVALIALMIVAFAIVALTRLSAGSAPAASPSPQPSRAVASTSPTPSPTVVVTPTPGSSVSPSASPVPSVRATYRVKKGDTLLAIAKHFGTTAAKIKAFNGLTSSILKIGQVLKIP